jgi:transcriptional regulator with XRE-family HTH domain
MDRDQFRRELGRRIAAWRSYRDLSQLGLAAASGLKNTSISRWERGESPIDAEDLYLIAEALEVDIIELLPSESEPDPSRVDRHSRVWSKAAA